ncbi:MAG: glycerol-3-phosphate dehydrogenase subunit GlpB [Spirochaetes bacterium]|nr:MAG: glycerol-3-phosphate dehydrogenase subunit GlpB [Spirochaetota bacterium]
MNYDCLIIGGGISGLTCGIRCQSAGLSTAILSAGMSALHFSSGSIDLIGYDRARRIVHSPFEYLKEFTGAMPDHPYAHCGVDTVREALVFLRDTLKAEELEIYDNGERNHFHVTGMGTLKPTYFSQRSVFNDSIRQAFERRAKIAVLNFEGYRDFYPELAISNLLKNELFKNVEIVTGRLVFPDYGDPEKNPFEYRSIDIARIFDTIQYLDEIAEQIKREAGDAEFVAMPAFIGINNYKKHHQILQMLTGKLIYEIPTLPPSILGMRLDDALKSRFADLGGVLIAGDKVMGGDFLDGVLDHVHTQNYGTTRLRARAFVLSTGSFFSGGLVSDSGGMREPVLNLRMSATSPRNTWYSPQFLDRKGHPFFEFGVETTGKLNPFDAEGKVIENMFCTGAILAHYNPIGEGSGGGVAVSTGYYAANQIIKACGK